MSASASLKLPPEKSVLKFKVGDEVKLSETDFVRLSTAFFAELEKGICKRAKIAVPSAVSFHNQSPICLLDCTAPGPHHDQALAWVSHV
jgi:hypothetical protein